MSTSETNAPTTSKVDGAPEAQGVAPHRRNGEPGLPGTGERGTVERGDGEQDGTLPEFLTVPETARLLRIGRKAVYAAVERGEIPGMIRVGKIIRFRTAAVLDWASRPQSRGRE